MLPTPTRAYLYSGPMDMRRSIDGLALLIEAMLKRSPFSGEVFVFFNKNLDKVKLLWWDRNGFWLAYKRLEKGRFASFPKASELSWDELMLLLEGVDLRTQRLGIVACERVN
jgi:transposase